MRRSAGRDARARALLAEYEVSLHARAEGQSMLDVLEELERRLIAKGFPPMSPWWRDTVRRFYESAKRQLVGRVGRRGGKSSTLSRLAVLEALSGDFVIPPGDVGMFAIISVDRQEASRRLRTIRAILDALEEPYDERGQTIELRRRAVIFAVFTASISGVSGPTCIGALCDEVAKWHDADTGANPATEVLASLRPTLLTQPSAKMFLSSSPFGKLDAHAKAYDEGDTARQMVAHAPTWVANPTVTEQQTHEEEPDEAVWSREYAAIPQEEVEEGILSVLHLDRAERTDAGDVAPEYGCHYVAHIDPATRGNAWTLAVVTRRMLGGRVRRSIVLAREWRGTPSAPLDPEVILGAVGSLIGPYGIDTVSSDSWAGDALAALARHVQVRVSETETKPLRLLVEPLSAADKLLRWKDVRTWFDAGEVEVPKEAQLRADLLSVRKVLTPNGYVIRFADTPDGRHADYAPSVAGALAKALRDPFIRDTRPDAVREQEEHRRQAEKRYARKQDVPWWKRTG